VHCDHVDRIRPGVRLLVFLLQRKYGLHNIRKLCVSKDVELAHVLTIPLHVLADIQNSGWMQFCILDS
jgi:hypothetical protein